MAESIDGLTVKMSLDSEDFINQMKKCESSVDKAERELSGLDKTTESVSKGEKKFAEYVEKANKQLKQASDDVSKAKREVGNLETEVTSASNAESKFSNAVDKANESLKKNSSSLDTAKQKTGELTDKSKEMEGGFSTAKDALGKVNSVLGLFGVSVGIGALITQVKELAERAVAARTEYENLYNQIYFIAGSLSEEQQAVVDDLVDEFSSDYSDAIANAVGGISTFFPRATEEQIKDISEELVTMQKRGFGDTATNVNLLNDLIKKYNLNLEDSVKLLSYLSATSMDTGESVNTLMSSVANADEIAKTTGKDIYSMIDFFGNAKALGNAGDVRGIDTQFETQQNRLISNIKTDYVLKGLSETEAYSKAVEDVTKLINDAFERASTAKSQAEASQIWADTFGVEVGKITNLFADFSTSINESPYEISRTQRNMALSGTTLTQQSIKKETAEDIDAQNEQAIDKWLSERKITSVNEFAAYYERYVREQTGNALSGIVASLGYKSAYALGIDGMYEDAILKNSDLRDKYVELFDVSNYDVMKSMFGNDFASKGDATLDKFAEILSKRDSENYDAIAESMYSKHPQVITITQNFNVPTADSYTVKNAAQQAINVSQSGSTRLV